MSLFDVLWAIILLPPILWEIYAIRNKVPGDTLSERLRIWWVVRKTGGKVAFLASLAALAVWLGWHIVWQQ